MDLADISTLGGTLPASNNIAVAASLFVIVEGARTMTSLVGADRFSSPYGGEIMGATYTGVLGLLTSVVVKSPMPVAAALISIVGFTALYHWQENRTANQ